MSECVRRQGAHTRLRARPLVLDLIQPVMKTTGMRICIELLARKASDFSRGRNCATVFSVARIPIDAKAAQPYIGGLLAQTDAVQRAEDAAAYGTIQQPV